MTRTSPPDDGDPSRVDLAADRTALANERTLAAWWRTAMAAIAASAVFPRLFGDLEPDWLLKGCASGLALVGLIVLAVAHRRYRRTARRIDASEVERLPRLWLGLGGSLLAIVAALAGGLVRL